MPSTPTWESLIESIGVERFETEFFGQRPLHLKQSFTPATGLESPEQWRGVLRGQTVAREAHRGRIEIDPAADTNHPISPDLDAMIEQGGPLIVGSINKINPGVADLARAMAEGLASFVGVNAYISPPRKDALDLHYDDHDVIVLQLHGEKLWTLGSRIARGVASSRFFQVDQYSLKASAIENDTFRTLEVQAGDLLYLPRGLFHRATASDGVSIHLSFGIRRPTGLDFVDLVMQRLIAETGTREYAPRLRPDNGDAEVLAYLDQMRDRIQAAAGDETARAEFLEQYRANFSGVTDKI
jgi:bifunctional lysine-specific demethylase and histidyl-hydroxylase MINA